MISSQVTHLKLVEWLRACVAEAKVDTLVPDTQAIFPYVADVLEQLAVSLDPVLQERVDAALQNRVDPWKEAFRDYPHRQPQALIQTSLSPGLLPFEELMAATAMAPQPVVVRFTKIALLLAPLQHPEVGSPFTIFASLEAPTGATTAPPSSDSRQLHSSTTTSLPWPKTEAHSISLVLPPPVINDLSPTAVVPHAVIP